MNPREDDQDVFVPVGTKETQEKGLPGLSIALDVVDIHPIGSGSYFSLLARAYIGAWYTLVSFDRVVEY